MIVKTETPDPRGNRGGRKIERLDDAFNFQNTASNTDLQVIRAAFLARRHRLTPNMAAVVAPLFFGEAPR